jgi:dTDP-glucose 4,6-dehydratase
LKRIAVLGAAGFIGSNFIQFLLNRSEIEQVLAIDLETYAANKSVILRQTDPRVRFYKDDIVNIKRFADDLRSFDIIVNFAAETHVDNSISDSAPFIHSNIFGLHRVLELARDLEIPLLQVSTDEVYGSIDDGEFSEDDCLLPNSPYAASKASGDLLCRSFVRTYGSDVRITRCSNNFGPFQHVEKFIPKVITLASQDKSIPLYGSGLNVREWIHVEDHCEAIWLVATQGQVGDIYNIGTKNRIENIALLELILQHMNKPRSLIRYVPDRLGHDHRYALNSNLIRERLGWTEKRSITESIGTVIQWYIANSCST